MMIKKKKLAPKLVKKNKSIPSVPFTLEEVYSLSQYQASEELWNRLRVWKASNDYAFIQSLSDLIMRYYSSRNRKLSGQERELRKHYIDWLVTIESDKFKSLDNIRLKAHTTTIINGDNEERNNDMLIHGGIL